MLFPTKKLVRSTHMRVMKSDKKCGTRAGDGILKTSKLQIQRVCFNAMLSKVILEFKRPKLNHCVWSEVLCGLKHCKTARLHINADG